jgi:NADH-ubiquinone oxidoreductase chain 5
MIHAMLGEQDMHTMGRLASLLLFTYVMMFIGNLFFIGFPFFIGFYFKDVILELIYIKYIISGNFDFWLGNVFFFVTSYHSFHLFFKTFLAPTNSFKQDILQCHDAPILMAIPLIFFTFENIFVGYLVKV